MSTITRNSRSFDSKPPQQQSSYRNNNLIYRSLVVGRENKEDGHLFYVQNSRELCLGYFFPVWQLDWKVPLLSVAVTVPEELVWLVAAITYFIAPPSAFKV